MAMLSGLITTSEEAQPTTGEFPQLPLAQIRRDGGTQPREGINQEHIDNMVATLEGGGSLPPVEVMYDGSHYWLVNGFHRCAAHERHGTDHLSVVIKQGTLDDAKWESLGANRELPRTLREIERNVKDALRHPRSQGMSNRALAAHLGVDHKTIGKYRNELQTTGEIPQLTQRTGADGKTRDVSGIAEANRQRAGEERTEQRADLENKCYRLQTWLMGKGWYRSRNLIGKGDWEFSWAEDDLPAQYRALRLAEEHQRRTASVSPLHILTLTETEAFLWNLINESIPDSSPQERLSWFGSLPQNGAYFSKYLLADQALDANLLETAWLKVWRALGGLTASDQPDQPLTFDETMSLVWRVVKAQNALSTPNMAFRWRNYRAWIERHEEPKDYKAQLPPNRKLDGQLLTNARVQIIAELNKNLETAKEARPLTLEETIALIWRVLKLDGPKGEPSPAERLHWLNLHALGHHYQHALNEGVKLDFAIFGQAWATVANELRRAIEHEQRTKERQEMHQKAAERTDVLDGPNTDAATAAPDSAPASPASEPEMRSRAERIVGLISMLETVSLALEAEYGELTGCFTHVPPAKRTLDTMIGQLKLQQTREG